MPSEIRYIFFDETEVKQALVKYSQLKKKPVKFEDIQNIVYSSEGDVGASLMMKYPGDGVLSAVQYSNSDLSAAMIIFCRDIHVPLPTVGVKTLQAEGDILSMCILLDDRVAFPVASDMRIMASMRGMMVQ